MVSRELRSLAPREPGRSRPCTPSPAGASPRRAVEPVEQPRDRCHTRKSDPRLAAGARCGDADEREGPTLAVHRLQVGARIDSGTRARGSARPARESSSRGRPRSGGGRARRAGKLAPVGPDRAPSASSAAAGSDGCAEAQKSFAKTACSRCCPASRGSGRRRAAGTETSGASTSIGSTAGGCRRSCPCCGAAARRRAGRTRGRLLGSSRSCSSSASVVPAPIVVPLTPRGRTSEIWTSRSACYEPVAQLRHELRASCQRLVSRFAAERREPPRAS